MFMLKYISKNSHLQFTSARDSQKNRIRGKVVCIKKAVRRNNGGIYYGSYHNETTSRNRRALWSPN